MKATRSLLAAMVLGTAIGASQANAQCSGNAGTCNTTHTASVTVGALVKLTMSSATTTLTAPLATDINTGALILNNGPTFTIKSNRAWNLKIKAAPAVAGFWDYSGTDNGQKPIADLAWSIVSGSGYAAITASDVTVASNGSASNAAAAAIFFQTTWVNDFSNVANAPGLYSLPIVFTLTAP
jgi:hypothetical protein